MDFLLDRFCYFFGWCVINCVLVGVIMIGYVFFRWLVCCYELSCYELKLCVFIIIVYWVYIWVGVVKSDVFGWSVRVVFFRLWFLISWCCLIGCLFGNCVVDSVVVWNWNLGRFLLVFWVVSLRFGFLCIGRSYFFLVWYDDVFCGD